MDLTPEEVLTKIQELDPLVVERAALMLLNEKQAEEIERLTNALGEEEPNGPDETP